MDNIKRKYGYSYDHQHRLTAAYYQLPGTVIPRSDSYSTSYSYDENGNILSLKRNGKEDDPNLLMEIDDLDYTYDQGNRLLKVNDATDIPAGFDMNGAGIHEKYAYDDFGNLKTDPYKKISHISYNHLNLPVKITFTGGETIEYTYLADGTKLKKTATDSENNTTTTEYRDGFQYQNNILEFFPHAEGYVKSTESVNGYIFNYVFTHTDHLGNIRIKYTRHPQTGEIRILEEDHYYPYGLTHEGYSGNHQIFGFDNQTFTLIDVMADETDTYKYKFNGMEWQDEFDVNLYDFGARNYDPALGRWMNIDPLAEMMRRHSPYNYAFNNPVYFIDPDGMMAIPGALKSGLLVQDTNFLGVSDISNGNMGSTASGESMAPEQNNSAAYKNYFQQVSDYAANADESLGGGCPDGDCDDKKSTKNPLKTALPCVKCHHSASVPQGNESGLIDLFKSRQSGYIQYGGNMRSGFIGDVIGEHGKLYGSTDNFLYPSDRSSKIKFLNYIIKLKGGGEIGVKIIETLVADKTVNIENFYYSTYDTIPAKFQRTPNGINLRGGYILKEKRKMGYIIDGDTIR